MRGFALLLLLCAVAYVLAAESPHEHSTQTVQELTEKLHASHRIMESQNKLIMNLTGRMTQRSAMDSNPL